MLLLLLLGRRHFFLLPHLLRSGGTIARPRVYSCTSTSSRKYNAQSPQQLCLFFISSSLRLFFAFFHQAADGGRAQPRTAGERHGGEAEAARRESQARSDHGDNTVTAVTLFKTKRTVFGTLKTVEGSDE